MNKQTTQRQFLNQYHEYIVNTNEWNDNVKEYLQGGDESLAGTILGFRRGWKKDRGAQAHYSFFLYFDHTTARVERYLINLGVKQDIEVIPVDEDLPFPEHKDIIDEENNKIIRPIYNSPYNIPNSMMIHNLHDGKLNKHFFSLFILELFRDYLIGGPSYTNPDISNILKATGPTNIRETSNGVKTGSGDISHWDPEYRDVDPGHSLFTFKRKEILNIKGKERKIMIPEIFNSKELNNLIQNYNFKLEVFNPKDQPLVIKDVKSMINSRTITRIAYIDRGMINLNVLKKFMILIKIYGKPKTLNFFQSMNSLFFIIWWEKYKTNNNGVYN